MNIYFVKKQYDNGADVDTLYSNVVSNDTRIFADETTIHKLPSHVPIISSETRNIIWISSE